jgi:hypothetical protein
MRASGLRPALLELLRAGEPAAASFELPAVWAQVKRWMAMPLDPESGDVAVECYLAGGRYGAASIDAPPGVSSDAVGCLELMRSVPTGPNVGVGLYYPVDRAWRELAAGAGWAPGLPFVAEHWAPAAGPLDAFFAAVEADPFFRLAAGRRADVVIAFDTDEAEEIRLRG